MWIKLFYDHEVQEFNVTLKEFAKKGDQVLMKLD